MLGEDGIINKAKEVANAMNNAVANDQKELDSLLNELNSVMNGWEEGGTGGNEITNTEPTPPPEPETPKLENTTGIQTENTKVEDKFGNLVTIPKGFEVVEQEGTTVPEGIVIQDKDGNQFVWIPVGRVYKDQTENTKVEDKFGNLVTIPKGFEVVEQEGTTVPEGIVIQDKDGNQFVWIPVGRVYKDATKNNYSDIRLGRYTFDETNGTPTPVQLAYTDNNPKNYEIEIKLS